jgi:hypothetical protein
VSARVQFDEWIMDKGGLACKRICGKNALYGIQETSNTDIKEACLYDFARTVIIRHRQDNAKTCCCKAPLRVLPIYAHRIPPHFTFMLAVIFVLIALNNPDMYMTITSSIRILNDVRSLAGIPRTVVIWNEGTG